MLPNGFFRRSCGIAVFLTAYVAAAQQPASSTAAQPPAGSNWHRVEVLPAKTKVHITTDHGGHTCRIFAVSEESLTCDSTTGRVIPRIEIQHIKLVHTGRSALVGAAIGGGIGATAGAIGGRAQPCPTNTQAFCLNGIGIGAGGVAAIFGIGGAAVGAPVGALTDFTRGSSIYVRP
jgi:hypothetical protein